MLAVCQLGESPEPPLLTLSRNRTQPIPIRKKEPPANQTNTEPVTAESESTRGKDLETQRRNPIARSPSNESCRPAPTRLATAWTADDQLSSDGSNTLLGSWVLSRSSGSVLSRLRQAGLLGSEQLRRATAREFLAQHWDSAAAFVVVRRLCGNHRLIAPLLKAKPRNPRRRGGGSAGRFAIPLLGGNGAGGEIPPAKRVAGPAGGASR